MDRRVPLRCVMAIVIAVVAAGAFAFESLNPASSSQAGSNQTHSRVSGQAGSQPRSKSTVADELAELQTSRVAEGLSIRELENAPGRPACPAPTPPAPTYPPGHTYGVPFLAAITNGQILFGYDEWVANNTTYTDRKGAVFHLYPWLAKVFDISGWVTGLLQLPNLSASISSADVVLCDAPAATCETDGPRPGCIYLDLAGAPFPGDPPSPTITSVPPKNKACAGSPSCVPYSVALTPSGTTNLTVTGVQADGALNLSVTTSATTTITLTGETGTGVCKQSGPTVIPLKTVAAGLPPGSPVPPEPGNTDYRSLQTLPTPLTGPLASASSTVASNDFSVPAFPLVGTCTFAQTLNGPLGGWNSLTPKDPPTMNNNYYDKNPLPTDAGSPGWGQFTATTTVVTLGLPVGPPPSFIF
jgi:hypothetical protein